MPTSLRSCFYIFKETSYGVTMVEFIFKRIWAKQHNADHSNIINQFLLDDWFHLQHYYYFILFYNLCIIQGCKHPSLLKVYIKPTLITFVSFLFLSFSQQTFHYSLILFHFFFQSETILQLLNNIIYRMLTIFFICN